MIREEKPGTGPGKTQHRGHFGYHKNDKLLHQTGTGSQSLLPLANNVEKVRKYRQRANLHMSKYTYDSSKVPLPVGDPGVLFTKVFLYTQKILSYAKFTNKTVRTNFSE